MAYPQGNPSSNFGATLYTSDFSPAIVCGGIIDNFTPVSSIGMKNSVGYQLSLTQNFVNETYLGREAYRVKEGWINTLYASGIDFNSTDNFSTIRSSGILGFMAPEAATHALSISGNYVGINKHDPEYELDVYGAARFGYSNWGGIHIYGNNGFLNYVGADADETQELYIHCYDANNSMIHLNPQTYGGVAINDQQYTTNDGDFYYNDNFTWTSGVIMWSDTTVSGFAGYQNRDIYARRVGRQITIYYNLKGITDTEGNIGFELPQASLSIGSGQMYYGGVCRGIDGQVSTTCSWSIQPGESFVKFHNDAGAFSYPNEFTTEDICAVEGFLIYEV